MIGDITDEQKGFWQFIQDHPAVANEVERTLANALAEQLAMRRKVEFEFSHRRCLEPIYDSNVVAEYPPFRGCTNQRHLWEPEQWLEHAKKELGG